MKSAKIALLILGVALVAASGCHKDSTPENTAAKSNLGEASEKGDMNASGNPNGPAPTTKGAAPVNNGNNVPAGAHPD